jgi:hypothetical protein
MPINKFTPKKCNNLYCNKFYYDKCECVNCKNTNLPKSSKKKLRINTYTLKFSEGLSPFYISKL